MSSMLNVFLMGNFQNLSIHSAVNQNRDDPLAKFYLYRAFMVEKNDSTRSLPPLWFMEEAFLASPYFINSINACAPMN